MTADPPASLAHTRVSTLLERSPEVLPCLVRHGFTPLQNPVMRSALAATVTLEQAIRIRGLSETQAHALYAELEEILTRPRG
ncbi:MAG: DUF1858 domain-containing protein [Trueperaceae bacterium]|nr:DUF1858 domain-containing protein [Trueperaceae bacterium]